MMTTEPVTGIPGTPALYDVNGTFYPYGLFMESLIEGLIDFETHLFYMMLVDATYLPNQNAHKFLSTVSGSELGNTYSGYSAGGMLMSISTISYTGTTKTLTIDASDVSWPLVTFPSPGARYGIMYDIMTKDGSNTSRRCH